MNTETACTDADNAKPAVRDQAIVTPCECSTWGRDDRASRLLLRHHPSCVRYAPEGELRALLLSLIDGIESWAADEDGVHPDCWEAYLSACAAVGQLDRSKSV